MVQTVGYTIVCSMYMDDCSRDREKVKRTLDVTKNHYHYTIALYVFIQTLPYKHCVRIYHICHPTIPDQSASAYKCRNLHSETNASGSPHCNSGWWIISPLYHPVLRIASHVSQKKIKLISILQHHVKKFQVTIP